MSSLLCSFFRIFFPPLPPRRTPLAPTRLLGASLSDGTQKIPMFVEQPFFPPSKLRNLWCGSAYKRDDWPIVPGLLTLNEGAYHIARAWGICLNQRCISFLRRFSSRPATLSSEATISLAVRGLQPRALSRAGAFLFAGGWAKIMTSKQTVLVVVGAIVLGIVAGLVYVKPAGPHALGTSSIVEPAKH